MAASNVGPMRLVALALVCLAAVAMSARSQPVEPADEARALFADCGLLAGYDRSWCQAEQRRFIDLYGRALRRDYHSQRRVALCLSSGCDGSVRVDRSLACAWRKLILASGSPYVDLSDTRNFRQDCAGLSHEEQVGARSHAGELMMRLYGKPLPEMPRTPLAG